MRLSFHWRLRSSAVAVAVLAGVVFAPSAWACYAAQRTLPLSGLSDPLGVAVDSSGNLFVADLANNRVVELSPGPDGQLSDGTQTTLPFVGLSEPLGVAVDSAGDVFVSDAGNDRVVELSPGPDGQLSDGVQTTLPFNGLSLPDGLAFDSTGALYVADLGNGRVVQLSQGPDGSLSDGAQATVSVSGLGAPYSLAFDSGNDLFVSDYGNSQILELTPGPTGFTQTTLPFSGLMFPEGVAQDAAGDLFVADNGNGRVVELSPGADGLSDGTQNTLAFQGVSPAGVAVDTSGDVIISDSVDNQVVEIPSLGEVSADHSTVTASPTTAPVGGFGSTITVNAKDAGGSNLTCGGASVTLGTTFGNLSGVTDNGDGTYSATLTSASTGTAVVTAKINDQTVTGSAAQVRFVTPPRPTVTGVTPDVGIGGTQITITGTGFTAGATVAIGQGLGRTRVPASNVDVVSATKITAAAGPSSKDGTFEVYVTTSAGTSPLRLRALFRYY